MSLTSQNKLIKYNCFLSLLAYPTLPGLPCRFLILGPPMRPGVLAPVSCDSPSHYFQDFLVTTYIM